MHDDLYHITRDDIVISVAEIAVIFPVIETLHIKSGDKHFGYMVFIKGGKEIFVSAYPDEMKTYSCRKTLIEKLTKFLRDKATKKG